LFTSRNTLKNEPKTLQNKDGFRKEIASCFVTDFRGGNHGKGNLGWPRDVHVSRLIQSLEVIETHPFTFLINAIGESPHYEKVPMYRRPTLVY